MDMTIHFGGRIADLGRVAELCSDLADISMVAGWDCEYVELVAEQIFGVVLLGLGEEPFPVIFNSDGYLCGRDLVSSSERPVSYGILGSEQVAYGWVRGLLLFIAKRYIPNLTVEDDGAMAEDSLDEASLPESIADQLGMALESVAMRRREEIGRLSRKQCDTYRFLHGEDVPLPDLRGEDEEVGRIMEYLENCERAPVTTYAKMLLTYGIDLPMPEDLNDKELHECLWRVINGLGELYVFLSSTDHLSDRELYERLWLEVLNEPVDDVSTDLQSAWHVDLAESGSEEDIQTYLRYYAYEDERRHFTLEYPDLDIPEHEEPPYKRAHLLPKLPDDAPAD